MDTTEQLLETFRNKVESQTHDNYVSRHGLTNKDLVRKFSETELQPGTKYIRVVIGRSSRYFIEKATGKIFGSAGWSKPNFKRLYGTLDTMDEWYWGEFYATSLKGVDTLVPKELR